MKFTSKYPQYIAKELKFCLMVISCFSTFCIEIPITKAQVIDIALIDFLYVSKNDTIARRLEKYMIIPAISRALDMIGTHNFKLIVKRVSNGSIGHFTPEEARKKASIDTSYDIAVWGLVSSFDVMLRDYNLQLILVTNPVKFKHCNIYYELEIRDTRIIRWNNKECNEPESAIALLPSILCYKLAYFSQSIKMKSAYSQLIVNNIIERRLSHLVGQIPTNELIAWHPDQDCELSQFYGNLFLKLLNGNEIEITIPNSLHSSLIDKLDDRDNKFSWPIKRNDLLPTPKVARAETAQPAPVPSLVGAFIPQRSYVLRSKSRKFFSDKEVHLILKNFDFFCKDTELSRNFSNPNGRGIANNFEINENGQVLLDHTSGLMWQQSGSVFVTNYEGATNYIILLNNEKFSGYNDWRLPTLEEAMSLMEPEKKNNSLFIDPVFDSLQGVIWTADKATALSAWVVYFNFGLCISKDIYSPHFVRAVRSSNIQK